MRSTDPSPGQDGIADGSRFYFVHEFYLSPADPSVSAGSSDYGIHFTCAVAWQWVRRTVSPRKKPFRRYDCSHNFVASESPDRRLRDPATGRIVDPEPVRPPSRFPPLHSRYCMLIIPRLTSRTAAVFDSSGGDMDACHRVLAGAGAHGRRTGRPRARSVCTSSTCNGAVASKPRTGAVIRRDHRRPMTCHAELQLGGGIRDLDTVDALPERWRELRHHQRNRGEESRLPCTMPAAHRNHII